jgi:heme exporter protein A
MMLEVKSLSCRRSGRTVFRGLGFRLSPGSLLQITGANGSGKSTLLRVLAGLLPKAEGDILWQGKPVDEDAEAHRARLHYLGHLDALKSEFSSEEMLDYWCALRHIPIPPRSDRMGTHAFRHKPIRALSAGQKKRVALLRLTLGGAPLWLLDEPTTALDAAGQKMLFALIADHRAKGGMVIAAVHHLLDVQDAPTLAMPGVF